MKILIIEDEEKVISFLKKGLEELGHQVHCAPDGKAAVEFYTRSSFDILLVDIILPDINGFELCKQFKSLCPDVPVIMLTALDTLEDKLDGFNAGADDYLVKPFEFKELVARINAQTKKLKIDEREAKVLRAGKVELDLVNKIARREGRDALLSMREFSLLELMMRKKNKVLTRAEIAEEVWDIRFDTGTNVVDVYINMLRKKIDKDFEFQHIQTRIGIGYVFMEE